MGGERDEGCRRAGVSKRVYVNEQIKSRPNVVSKGTFADRFRIRFASFRYQSAGSGELFRFWMVRNGREVRTRWTAMLASCAFYLDECGVCSI